MGEWFLGLDLGCVTDFSALAALEKAARDDGSPAYSVRHLHRWALGTPYTRIATDLAGMLDKPPLAGCRLVVDGTGVGAAVIELLDAQGLNAELTRVIITGGQSMNRGDDGSYHVPKKELVGVLQVLLQARRLLIAKGLEHARTLAKEFQTFRVKVTAAGNETFEAWRERDHDDLVLAVALAAWLGERTPWDSGAEPFAASGGRGKSAGRRRV
jgi:hypothetical protein